MQQTIEAIEAVPENVEFTGDPSVDEALLEAALAEVEQLNKRFSKPTLQTNTDGLPAMAVTRTHDGMITIFATDTGMPSTIMRYMLPNALKKTREDGKAAFSLHQQVVYHTGQVLCMLNPEHPLRPLLNSIGLRYRTCRKKTIASEGDLRFHMQHRHKQEWEIYQVHIKDEETRLQRELMEAQLAALKAQMAGQSFPERMRVAKESKRSKKV